MLFKIVLSALELLLPVTGQVARDPGVAGPPIELIHLYNDEFPTGKLVLSSALIRFSFVDVAGLCQSSLV